MARRQTGISASEIEALRRRLAVSSGGDLPDEVRQKFERLVAIADNKLFQDEASRLTRELHQASPTRLSNRGRPRKIVGPVQVDGVRLEPPLLTALDRFIKERDASLSRAEAIRIILKDALAGYGLLPREEPPPKKADAN